MIELLAPAGSMEALRAAVQNGADAVYLGAGAFNARQGAKNFTLETLREAVQYAHIRGTAVHLTVNTLVTDRECPQVAELIAGGGKAGRGCVHCPGSGCGGHMPAGCAAGAHPCFHTDVDPQPGRCGAGGKVGLQPGGFGPGAAKR